MKKKNVSPKKQFALRVSSGFNQGTLIHLSRKKLILGRSQNATIPLEDDRASREHTAIFLDKGKYFVQDMSSTNGTYLNNELLAEARALNPGDYIRIGSSIFRFEILNPGSDAESERWKNATCVIPRAHFSFDELARIRPERYRFMKKNLRKARRNFELICSWTSKALNHLWTRTELRLTRILFRSQKYFQRIRLR